MSTIICQLLITGAALSYTVKWELTTVTSFDGVVLNANVGYPTNLPTIESTVPAIVMPNSWGVPDLEYIAKTLEWAESGYVVVEYETRGFYGSGGEIGTAGPADQKDISAVLDHIVANAMKWHADGTTFGMAGISYGAGLSALGAAHDARIKCVASMSGWGNLSTALNGASTPSLVWGEVLIEAGRATGHESPALAKLFSDVVAHRNMSEVRAFVEPRSPEFFKAALEARHVPVFISNNFEDHLFKPDAALEYFQNLNSGISKQLILNQGIHASAELSGILGLPNMVLDRAKRWLDHYLKGVANGVEKEPIVSMELRRFGLLVETERVEFTAWPSANVTSTALVLSGRGAGHAGALSPAEQARPRVARSSSNASDVISFGLASGFSAGVPILAPALQVFLDVPILADLAAVDTKQGAVYLGEPLSRKTRFCGVPNVTLSVTPDAEAFQIVAYLYFVDALGIGTLVAHGPTTVWGNGGGSGVPRDVDVRLRAMCADAPKGTRIGLGIDLYDVLYAPANEYATVLINFDGDRSVIHLPVNK